MGAGGAAARPALSRLGSGPGAAESQAGGVARGMHMGAGAPFGYVRLKSGRLRVDAARGPLATQLFRRRADGAGISELCHWMEAQGIPGPREGAAGTSPRCAHLLERRVSLGEVSHGRHRKAGAHEPLTDPATWQRCQQAIERRPHRKQAPPALLNGLARCAGCRRLMTAFTQHHLSGGSHGQYYCLGKTSAGRCQARATARDVLVERYVERIFWEQLKRRTRPAGAERALAEARTPRSPSSPIRGSTGPPRSSSTSTRWAGRIASSSVTRS